MSLVTFGALRTAAYCPRQLYYERRSDGDPPDPDRGVRELASRYDELRRADDDALAAEPLAVEPAAYRRALASSRDRLDRFGELCDPPRREVLVTGRRCRGIVHKVLEEPPAPSLLSTGRPPERGVWGPQSVHAVAAAKALSWEREVPVEIAYCEYPAHGVIRRIQLTTRRKATYRRVLRTVETMDGPPPRVRNRSKCDACEFADECGVKTRTLRSLLGFGD